MDDFSAAAQGQTDHEKARVLARELMSLFYSHITGDASRAPFPSEACLTIETEGFDFAIRLGVQKGKQMERFDGLSGVLVRSGVFISQDLSAIAPGYQEVLFNSGNLPAIIESAKDFISKPKMADPALTLRQA